MNRLSTIASFGATTFLFALSAGCSPSITGPVTAERAQPAQNILAGDIQRQPGDLRPTLSVESTGSQPALTVTIPLDKSAIFSQEFLYGADLQHSSLYDKSMDLYQQSVAIGHIPARFREVGDELQLIADNKRLYPSDINHPEQLISRFKILSETATTIVVSGANSSGFLGEVFEGAKSGTDGGLSAASGKPPRDSWIRSLDYDKNGAYLLQQTSVILDDGSIGEFMESIFPRQNLAASNSFEKIEMDPEDPVGGDSGVVARFRLLPSEKIHDGEKTLSYAQHYDIAQDINWYVTRNIPDEDLEPVKNAVEGWNRYFRAFAGISRDIVHFKGRLPDGIYLGDPRYNVINWDSRRIAGAAYETQASDPTSGKQSHSLIYMPAAWLQIGTDYWNKGRATDAATSAELSSVVIGKASDGLTHARISCARDISDAAALIASGRLEKSATSTSADVSPDVKKFGIQLLKQTLFHEVGHSLGLAHNFKGSLSFDRSNPKSIFSTSIMDYNDFEIERGAFYDVNSSDGPQLEYDRQAISALYNKSVDIKSTDPVVPTCNDAEADIEPGGVDPLCIRYDAEKDPTLAVNTALNRIGKDAVAGDVTLTQSLRKIPGLVLTNDRLALIKTSDDLDAISDSLSSAIEGVLEFYAFAGKTSLSRSVVTNLKSLLQIKDGVLPAPYDARQMRERAFAGVQQSLALYALPDSATQAIQDAIAVSILTLEQTPYGKTLSGTDRDKLDQETRKTLAAVPAAFVKTGLAKMRATILAALKRHSGVSYFDGSYSGAGSPAVSADYETALVGILVDALDVQSGRSKSERVAAATALQTYKGLYLREAVIKSVIEKLKAELTLAPDNASRDLAQGLLTILEKKSGVGAEE